MHTFSLPQFGGIVESILENTISNILIEAFNKEFTITNRPRLIALPPKETLKPNLLVSKSISSLLSTTSINT